MEIQLVGGAVATIDDEDFDLVSGFRWRTNREGYAACNILVDGKTQTVFMHRLINRTPDGRITDHIDQDKLNNRRSNLRTASRAQNCFSSKLFATNKSGFRGVTKVNNRWRAIIVVDGRQEHLGYFADPEAASHAYQDRLAQVA